MPGMARIRTLRRGPAAIALLAAVALASCSDPLRDESEAANARAHLETLLDVMEANSVNRKLIDWTRFRSAVLAEAPDPPDLGGTFQAIYVALGLLGDNQSMYIAPRRWNLTITSSTVTCTGDTPAPVTVPPDIGYVRVFNAAGGTGAQSYASSMQGSIRSQDTGARTGWIVDLRGNRSSDMWPMITGMGPFLGEGTVGYFVDPDGVETEWRYLAGASLLGGSIKVGIGAPHTLTNGNAPVAVLLDGGLGGYGEGVAMAFMGRPNTRFFGKPSCGLSAALSSYGIEGAALVLAVSRMADRDKVVHSGPLVPDVATSTHQELFDSAVAWLRGG